MVEFDDVYGFTFNVWEKDLFEGAVELLVKQERKADRSRGPTKITAKVESMLEVIRNAPANHESVFSLKFREE